MKKKRNQRMKQLTDGYVTAHKPNRTERNWKKSNMKIAAVSVILEPIASS